MTTTYCILLPSLIPTGPIKGAIALANRLITRGKVYLILLKSGSDAAAVIDERINLIPLWKSSTFFLDKIFAYRDFLDGISSSAI